MDVSTRLQLALKRAMDIAAAGVSLAVFAPVLAGVAAAIRLESPGSPVFSQSRAGRLGRPFTLYKFRSMLTEDEARRRGIAPGDEANRITPVGRFIRSTSLDELPQLVNVLKGDMSIVGPRALLLRYVDRYSPGQRARLLAKPGITGLAQVRGRNELTWDEKFALDAEYVERWSIWLDIRLLAETVVAVLGRKGIYAGEAIMPEFMGNEKVQR